MPLSPITRENASSAVVISKDKIFQEDEEEEKVQKASSEQDSVVDERENLDVVKIDPEAVADLGKSINTPSR